MVDGRQFVAVKVIFLSLASLAAAFQLCGLMSHVTYRYFNRSSIRFGVVALTFFFA